MKAALAVAVLALSLGGCGALSAVNAPSPTTAGMPSSAAQKLAEFAASDVAAALADAKAQTPPDAVAIACWSDVLAVLPSLNVSTLGAPMLLQKARDGVTVGPAVMRDCQGMIPFP